MELSHRESIIQGTVVGEMAGKTETQEYRAIIDDMAKKNVGILAAIEDGAEARASHITRRRQMHAAEYTTAQKEFAEASEALEQKLQSRLVELKGDLDVGRRVHLQEIAEHVSLHIRALEDNHLRVFGDMKTFYREATRDNLRLIQKLKADIKTMAARKQASECLAATLAGENQGLRDSFREAATVKAKLSLVLEEQDKTRLFLSNARARHRATGGKLERARETNAKLEGELRAISHQEAALGTKFQGVNETGEVDRVQQLYLEQRLEQARQSHAAALKVTSQVAASCHMDPALAGDIRAVVEEAIHGRNQLIEDLKFRLLHLRLAFDSTLRKCKGTLGRFGIQPSALDAAGFVPLVAASR
jgi:hypothetical protein